jgi:hypothetical protein
MKSDMTDSEFRKIVMQLASRFSGGKFNERASRFRYWKR